MPEFPLKVLSGSWAVARLAPLAPVPVWALEPCALAVVARTSEELSIVCPEERVPTDVQAERGFRAIAVEGPVPLDVTGLMASLASALAGAEISIFPVATYDTDYVLVRWQRLERAIDALRSAGWVVKSGGPERGRSA